MTLNRKILKRVNSPVKSPKLANSSLRRRTLLKRLSSGGVHFGASSKANLKVVVRVRPENKREIESNSRSVVDIVDEHMLIFDPKREENDFFFQGTKQKFRDLSKKVNKEQKFMFEKVFDPQATNEEIYENTTKDIVNTILDGYNCSVFAYGATGSGKTYTMIGNEEFPGITFLTVMELYTKIAELEETKTFEVAVSYLEVYNEMVRDLLSSGKPLSLHEAGQHVQVTGLSLHKPKCAEDLLKILADGNRNRSQHPTDANAESSRSHAVFQVFVRQQSRSSNITSGVSIAKLSMIDLAGSERGSVTGFKGARFREGASINKSLLALGNCINALADGKGHIPYRDSKLTRLLKDSIGGNCRSVMIATITKSALSFEDTYNTLRYANRAKTIKTTVKKNFLNVDQHVSQYLKIVEELKLEVTALRDKLRKYEEEEEEKDFAVVPLGVPLTEEERTTYEETIEKLTRQLKDKEMCRSEERQKKKELLDEVVTLNSEVKGLKREILQLETAERELEWKMYIQQGHLVKMKVFVFASSRLEKGIAKSERSVRRFQKNLEHIQKQKKIIAEKTSSVQQKIVTLCETFRENSPQEEEVEEPSIPDPFAMIKDVKIEQGLRDSTQINEYFEKLVQNLYKEKEHDEKLINLLLLSNKYFYLKLTTLKGCDSETDKYLENIYGMLDTSRIEWADLKNTENSFGEQSIGNHLTCAPAIGVDRLTEFNLANVMRFSPLLNDISKVHKSNILRSENNSASIGTVTPISSKTTSLNLAEPETNRTTSPENTVDGIKRLCNTTFTSPDSLNSSARERINSLQKDTIIPLEERTPPLQKETFSFSLQKDNSPSLQKDNFSPSLQDSFSPPLLKDNISPPLQKDTFSPPLQKDTFSPPLQKDTFSPPLQKDTFSSPLQKDTFSPSLQKDTFSPSLQKDTFSPPLLKDNFSPPLQKDTFSPLQKDTFSPLQKDTFSPSLQKDTFSPLQKDTFSPSLQKEAFSLSLQKETFSLPLQKDVVSPHIQKYSSLQDTSFLPLQKNALSSPFTKEEKFSSDTWTPDPCERKTPSSQGDTFTPPSPVLSHCINDTTITVDSCDPVSRNENAVNETFCLDVPSVNSTFCVAVPENSSNVTHTVSPKEDEAAFLSTKGNSRNPLAIIPSFTLHEPNNLCNVISPKEDGSMERLSVHDNFKKPSSTITPAKFSFSRLPNAVSRLSFKSSFKRSTSVSALSNGAAKLPSGGCSSSNKENSLKKSTSFVTPKAAKTVAFGSSFSTRATPTGSKKSLTYQTSKK